MRNGHGPELVVLSHLRWNFVWQRPQHIISRLAANRRTWFVEEPLGSDVTTPQIRQEQHGDVTRVWLEVPGGERHVPFDAVTCPEYADELVELLGPGSERLVWLYTPMALFAASRLRPSLLVYDVMDDLASFKDAPAELKLRHRQALRAADLAFTGGRSLHRGVLQHRPHGTHLFPSGVEPEHFSKAQALRQPVEGRMPVAGYVGVVDERLDTDLIAAVAHELPDWEIRIVGPVVKIDPATLPRAANIVYQGAQPYARLPEILAGFDVALMPFALNQATRSISPTKTLEYLAAGLPVVSTRVPDVVADYRAVVDLAAGAQGFARACRRALAEEPGSRLASVEAVLRTHHWDAIAGRMSALVSAAGAGYRKVIA